MQSFLNEIEKIEFGSESQRLIHGRGGKFPEAEHLCLDWFEPVLLLTSFKPLADEELARLVQAVETRWQQVESSKLNLVYQHRAAGKTVTQIIRGEVPEQHIINENGCLYQVHLTRGQNHGLFLDMANGRALVKRESKGKNVLNLFAYTCGFSVAALKGGADQVVNIDMAKGALSIGKQNHLHNGLTAGARFLGHDIFKSWGKLTKLGPYDLVIADPPSNQKGSFVATKDYVRLLKRLPELVAEGGELLLCLNAPELTSDFLKQQVMETAPSLTFVERIDNPEVFDDIDMEKALKVLRYRKS